MESFELRRASAVLFPSWEGSGVGRLMDRIKIKTKIKIMKPEALNA